MFVELGLRDGTTEFGGDGPAVSRAVMWFLRWCRRSRMNAVSSKSSRPAIAWVSAVVRPPLNRLSMSRSSVTSIMDRIAAVSRSVLAIPLHLRAWQLKTRVTSVTGSAWGPASCAIRSEQVFGLGVVSDHVAVVVEVDKVVR